MALADQPGHRVALRVIGDLVVGLVDQHRAFPAGLEAELPQLDRVQQHAGGVVGIADLHHRYFRGDRGIEGIQVRPQVRGFRGAHQFAALAQGQPGGGIPEQVWPEDRAFRRFRPGEVGQRPRGARAEGDVLQLQPEALHDHRLQPLHRGAHVEGAPGAGLRHRLQRFGAGSVGIFIGIELGDTRRGAIEGCGIGTGKTGPGHGETQSGGRATDKSTS